MQVVRHQQTQPAIPDDLLVIVTHCDRALTPLRSAEAKNRVYLSVFRVIGAAHEVTRSTCDAL